MSQQKVVIGTTQKSFNVAGNTTNVGNVNIPQNYSTANYVYGTSANSGKVISGGQTRVYDNTAIGLISGQNGGYTTTQNYSTIPQSYNTQAIETRYFEPLRIETRVESRQPYIQEQRVINQGAVYGQNQVIAQVPVQGAYYQQRISAYPEQRYYNSGQYREVVRANPEYIQTVVTQHQSLAPQVIREQRVGAVGPVGGQMVKQEFYEEKRPVYQKLYSNSSQIRRKQASDIEAAEKKSKCCSPCCWVLWGLLGLAALTLGLLFGLGVIGNLNGPDLNLNGGNVDLNGGNINLNGGANGNINGPNIDLNGGAANGTISGGNVNINGGNANGTVNANGTINGGANGTVNGGANGTINGGNVDINGGNANGTINAGNANGTINGGNANGTINGGNANGTINGGNANGTINGGNANGTINGGQTNGTINGGGNNGGSINTNGGAANGTNGGAAASNQEYVVVQETTVMDVSGNTGFQQPQANGTQANGIQKNETQTNGTSNTGFQIPEVPINGATNGTIINPNTNVQDTVNDDQANTSFQFPPKEDEITPATNGTSVENEQQSTPNTAFMFPPTEESAINTQKNGQTIVIEQTTIVHPVDKPQPAANTTVVSEGIKPVSNGTVVAQPVSNGTVITQETKPVANGTVVAQETKPIANGTVNAETNPETVAEQTNPQGDQTIIIEETTIIHPETKPIANGTTVTGTEVDKQIKPVEQKIDATILDEGTKPVANGTVTEETKPVTNATVTEEIKPVTNVTVTEETKPETVAEQTNPKRDQTIIIEETTIIHPETKPIVNGTTATETEVDKQAKPVEQKTNETVIIPTTSVLQVEPEVVQPIQTSVQANTVQASETVRSPETKTNIVWAPDQQPNGTEPTVMTIEPIVAQPIVKLTEPTIETTGGSIEADKTTVTANSILPETTEPIAQNTGTNNAQQNNKIITHHQKTKNLHRINLRNS